MAVAGSVLDRLKDDRVLRKHSSKVPSPVSEGVPAISGLVQSTTSATAGNDARPLNSCFPAFQPCSTQTFKAPPPGIRCKAPPPAISIATPARCSSPPPPPSLPPPGATSPGSSAAAPAALEIPSGAPKSLSPVADPAAAAADARAAQQRGDEIARGLRVLKKDFVRKVGDWDISVYARLERYRDAEGQEWQYDPLSYEWRYVQNGQ